MKNVLSAVFNVVLALAVSFPSIAAPAVTPKDKPFEGYTLFAPLSSKSTYLMDNTGKIVHTWKHKNLPGISAYLLENGNLLRPAKSGNEVFKAGGVGGIIESTSWDGDLLWEYQYSNDKHSQHHDVKMMPNGNAIFIAWERKTDSEAVKAGRNPKLLKDSELWPDSIIEVKPTGPKSGKIVWEWHLWDHLIQDFDKTRSNYGKVDEHPELVDLNFIGTRNPKNIGGKDWTHTNAVAYNAKLDQVLISVHGFSEIWIIDHSTTTEEARGHKGGRYGKGGDLLYRWGNPRAYRAGSSDDQVLFGQHDAQWIEDGLKGEGNILVFNNGLDRKGDKYSTVMELKAPVTKDGSYDFAKGKAFGPNAPVWMYKAENPTDFYSSHVSGAQRQPNGNTLVCNGTNGIFFEVTPAGEVVWRYVNKFTDVEKETGVFKIRRYSSDYPGLRGKVLGNSAK